MKFFDKLFSKKAPAIPVIPVNELSAAAGSYQPNYDFAYLNGDKFIGGFGDTQLHIIDYWTLRQRSIQLYNENIYAQGIINTFVTNIINTGLTLECTPNSTILGLDDDFLNNWSENVEARFKMYSDNPMLCDYYGRKTYGELQAQRELQALVEGDVLTVYHFDSKTMMPKVQLISSNAIQSPLDGEKSLKKGHTVEHGVELDAEKRVVAYHVVKNDDGYVRYPCYGVRSGRRVAHLYIPGKSMMDHVRGMPLLGNVLQSLREIDRYRDSVQRKALAASFIALAVEKDADTVSAKTLGSASNRSLQISNSDDFKLNLKSFSAGTMIDDMPAGHKIKLMGSEGTDLSFKDFEETIIAAIAWTKEIPPEVMRKAFSSNYAASKQANAEFAMFLDSQRVNITKSCDQPFYIEWLYIEVSKGDITADGLLQAWFDPSQYAIKGAWCAADWTGSIKPNADLIKEANGHRILCEQGFSTRSRAAASLTGTKFSTNTKRLKLENQQLADAMRPMLELEKEFTPEAVKAMMDSNIMATGDNDAVSE